MYVPETRPRGIINIANNPYGFCYLRKVSNWVNLKLDYRFPPEHYYFSNRSFL
jgi:hypothetical protein